MWAILSGKKVQKMGGFQVSNEASEALLAHEQTRASVMSMQRSEVVGAVKKGERHVANLN